MNYSGQLAILIRPNVQISDGGPDRIKKNVSLTCGVKRYGRDEICRICQPYEAARMWTDRILHSSGAATRVVDLLYCTEAQGTALEVLRIMIL